MFMQLSDVFYCSKLGNYNLFLKNQSLNQGWGIRGISDTMILTGNFHDSVDDYDFIHVIMNNFDFLVKNLFFSPNFQNY